MDCLSDLRARGPQPDVGVEAMGLVRRSRDCPPVKRRVLLGERDLKILRAIGRMQFATTAQIRACFFSGATATVRRLGKLVASGLLKVHVPCLAGENVYGLSAKGVDTVIARCEADEEEIHRGTGAPRSGLAHAIAINDLRVALTLACRSDPQLSVELFLSDADLRRQTGARVPPSIPDALVVLVHGGRRLEWVVEIDLGTEPASFVAATKGRLWAALRERRASFFGLNRWQPLLLAPDLRRLRHLARALATVGACDFVIAGLLPELSGSWVSGQGFAPLSGILARPEGEFPWTETLLSSRGRVC